MGPPAQASARRFLPSGRALVVAGLVAALNVLLGCNPIGVRSGQTTQADVTVPTLPVSNVNMLAMGRADADGRIELKGTGISVNRGETVMIGMSGPGMIPGTGFVVLGFGFQLSVVRFGETQGGSGSVQPAVVLSLVVPRDTPPGLYSMVASRGFEFALFSGSIEVL